MSKSYVTPNGMTASEAYDILNSRYWRNRLPKVEILWPKYMLKEKPPLIAQTVGGKKRAEAIHFNPKYKNASTIWLRTLIHEMVHVEQWDVPLSRCHGNKFEKRMKHLASVGAFRGLW